MTNPRSLRYVVALGALLLLAGVIIIHFPGRRLCLAFTIATGVGTPSLQERIDKLEDEAIRSARLSPDDKGFLRDFYGTLATGAELSVIVRQTGHLMNHYLGGSGAEYRLASDIFTENKKVQAQMSLLRARAGSSPCIPGKRFASPTFYMPDASKLDSVFGLYHGTLWLTQVATYNNRCVVRFRAEVPWNWPSYSSLKQKYGRSHAESFPLPNLRSIVLGPHNALFVDNGLGEYLVHVDLAKPFLAFAEWDEILTEKR